MALQKLDIDRLSGGLGPIFFELQSLVDRHCASQREENKQLLSQILKYRRRPIPEWEAQVVFQFLEMGVALTRAEWLNSPVPKEWTGIAPRLEWWCSLAAVHANEMMHIAAARLLAIARCIEIGELPRLEWLEDTVRTDAVAFDLRTTVAESAARIEWVVQARHSYKDSQQEIGEQFAVVRELCNKLVGEGFVAEDLSEAAIYFGVTIPERSRKSAVSDNPGAEQTLEEPLIWKLPKGEEDLGTELQNCLFELIGIADEKDTPLSPLTCSQVRDVLPSLEAENFEQAFFFSAKDLWRAFVLRGDGMAREASQRILLFLCRVAEISATVLKHRANSLHWWMNTQLPLLFRTCDLPSIIQDAEGFYKAAKIPRGDLTLLQGVVEAFAGECRRLELTNDIEERRTLIEDHWEDLINVHNRYHERAGARGTEEEAAAWDYLLSVTGHEAAAPPPGLIMKTFAEHPDLKLALQGGAHGSVKAFIESQLDEIKVLLGRRLNVRLAPEFVIEPDGEVYQREAERRRQIDPSFASAKQLLKKKDFARATQILERLLPHLQGRPEDICRNHLAFAQARQGHLLEARTHLATLIQGEIRESSRYWNLACCIPSDNDQTSQRIEVLLAGLQKAPHPMILDALIYLGLLVDDIRVREWIKSLPLVEALLLSFLYDYEMLDFRDRDRALVRLNDYVRRGEPKEPDPTAGAMYGTQLKRYRESVNRYLDTLLELHQPQVFEFWLRCREVFADHKYEYWEAKVDFLKRTGRMDEAAKAFADEVRLRVGFMQHAARQVFPPFLRETRERAREWLLQCMVPELKDIGHRVYQTLKNQEKVNDQFKGQLLPNDRRIQTFYAESPKIVGIPLHGSVTAVGIGGLGAAPGDLAGLLATVSAECQSGLHEISQVALFEPRLEQLRNVLSVRQFPRSSAALAELMRIWLHGGDTLENSQPESLLQAAQAAVIRLKTELESELLPDLQLIAGQLLRTFERVNQHFARDSHLLPKLIIEPIIGDSLLVDPRVASTAFAIRVRADEDSRPIRLVGGTAMIDGEHTAFTLRDQLAEVETMVAPGQTAILTFQYNKSAVLVEPRRVCFQIKYEFMGRRYTSKPLFLQIACQECAILPESSPYIFARALEAEEIDGHFFGRVEEQRAILESVRDGQQRLRYIEGIRRAGKSSLLHSVECEISRRGLPLIPVYVQAASVAATDDAGRILFSFLNAVGRDVRLLAAELNVPSEDQCRSNLKTAYSEFLLEISLKLPGRRIVILLDDFQVVVETGLAAREVSPALFQGIIGLLNLIFENASPRSTLLWVFAGQRAFSQFKSMLPGALLWGILNRLPIDFLDQVAVGEILRGPLLRTAMSVPDETVARVHRHTGGHPEVVQQVAEQMLNIARKECRSILTPSDADQAARDVADYSDNFAATWYPVAELSGEQKQLVAAFLNAVPNAGGAIEPFKLIAGGDVSDAARKAISDLIARKIFDARADGALRLKAYVLDRWLRRFVRTEFDGSPGFGVHGSVAIFIDVANLTAGTGSCWLDNLETSKGEDGVAGRFSLATVLTAIESWSRTVSPAPIVARWVINYPLKSPAVVECNAKGYQVENIPQELFEKGKGQDDVTLREKISEVEQWFGTANHFVIVAGDKDYCLTADRLLKNGRFVHFVFRAGALSANVNSRYQVLARQHPDRFTLTDIESLLESAYT